MSQHETLILASDGDARFDAYLALPDTAGAPRGGVMVLSEMFGLNGPMREVADGFAARGHPAMVPNVFWRSSPSGALAYEGPEREIAWQRLAALDIVRIARELRHAVARLRAAPGCSGKVAAVGFCGGGRIAFLAAAHAGVDAAVAFYALGISRDLAVLPEITCPLQLHYGSRDQHVPAEEIAAVCAAVQGRPDVTVHLYDAGHSFFNPVRPTYDAKAAALAGERVDQLLASL